VAFTIDSIPMPVQGNRFWKSENQKGEHKKNFLALSLRS